MSGPQRNPYVLGMGKQTYSFAQPQWLGLAASYKEPATGWARIYWRISKVIAGRTAAPPRVKIGWQAQSKDGNTELSLIADAWYGQVELQGSSFSIQAGYGEDDTGGGSYEYQATIVDGASGAPQSATFTRHCILPSESSTPVYVPGATGALAVNTGAHRAIDVTWYNSTLENIAFMGQDWAGNDVQLTRTGPTPALADAVDSKVYSIHPSLRRLLLTNRSLTDVLHGLLTFRYF